eukprot:2066664-Amphidinium_carterae.1
MGESTADGCVFRTCKHHHFKTESGRTWHTEISMLPKYARVKTPVFTKNGWTWEGIARLQQVLEEEPEFANHLYVRALSSVGLKNYN